MRDCQQPEVTWKCAVIRRVHRVIRGGSASKPLQAGQEPFAAQTCVSIPIKHQKRVARLTFGIHEEEQS
jgi:hypothetical protein